MGALLLDLQFQRPLDKLIHKLLDWIDFLVLKTPNIILGVLALVAFILISKAVSKAVGKVAEKTKVKESFRFLLIKSVRYSIQIMGLFVALNVIGLDKTVTSLLAGAGIIGLALSFAFQNIATNFISGILINLRQTYKVDDWIETQGIQGKVIEITVYHTVLATETGQHVTLPNKEILESPLYNYSREGTREIELMVGISYNDDLDAVLTIVRGAIERVPTLLKDKAITLYYKEFGDSSINLEVNFWIRFERQRNYDVAVSDAIRLIKKELDQNEISIPFPITTIELEQIEKLNR